MPKPVVDSPIPSPPRRHKRHRPGEQRAPRTLSRGAIIDAAMHVLDTEGLDALTMRRVAEELGTGPASLYAHVADKDELVALLLDRVFSEMPLPARIDPNRWQQQLKEMVRTVRRTFNAHRDIARASMGVIPLGEGALPGMNAMVGVLRAGNVVPEVASLSVDILALYATATAYEESMESFPTSPEENASFHVEMKDYFAGLPVDRFPHLVAMAGPLTTGDREHRFEFGLDLLVRGIASTVKPARKR